MIIYHGSAERNCHKLFCSFVFCNMSISSYKQCDGIHEFFYYDVHLFKITCKEISISQSANQLSIADYKFYNHQTQKSYEITREFVCLSTIANLFNQTFFNFDSKLNNQQQPKFSEE